MIKDAQVARDNLVLEERVGGDVDALPLVGDDDDRSLELDASTKVHVATDGEVVKLEDLCTFVGTFVCKCVCVRVCVGVLDNVNC